MVGGWINPLQTLSQGLVLTLRFTFGPELDNTKHPVMTVIGLMSSSGPGRSMMIIKIEDFKGVSNVDSKRAHPLFLLLTILKSLDLPLTPCEGIFHEHELSEKSIARLGVRRVFKGDLKGDSKGDIRGAFNQDLKGNLLSSSQVQVRSRSGPGLIWLKFNTLELGTEV